MIFSGFQDICPRTISALLDLFYRQFCTRYVLLYVIFVMIMIRHPRVFIMGDKCEIVRHIVFFSFLFEFKAAMNCIL